MYTYVIKTKEKIMQTEYENIKYEFQSTAYDVWLKK